MLRNECNLFLRHDFKIIVIVPYKTTNALGCNSVMWHSIVSLWYTMICWSSIFDTVAVDVVATPFRESTAMKLPSLPIHYSDVIMGVVASQITSLTMVYSTVYSGTDRRKHQSSTSLGFVRGIHRWPVNSPHKGPVRRKMFPFNGAIM